MIHGQATQAYLSFQIMTVSAITSIPQSSGQEGSKEQSGDDQNTPEEVTPILTIILFNSASWGSLCCNIKK